MSRKIIVPVALILLIAVCALLGGCFRSAGQAGDPAATPGPTAGATVQPAPMVTPGAQGQDAQNGQNSQNGQSGQNGQASEPAPAAAPYDWVGQGSAVEGRIGMFSEVQECRVVTSGNTALVGVRFTSAYQGEMTQRIRDMIAGEVMAADTGIQVVAVTSEKADVDAIYQLSDRQRAGASAEELKPEVERIARNATTLR